MLFTMVVCQAQINTDRMMSIARNALSFDDYVLSISYFNIVINYKPYLYEPYFYRGVAKFYLDDYSGAIRDCSEAIRRNPYFPSSYELRGLAHINLDQFAEAAADYQIATDMSPENRSVWHNLTLCYMELDSLDRADHVTDSIIKKWPRYADGYNLKAQVLLQKKDTITAEAFVDRALAADKYNINALNAKGGILMNHEKQNAPIGLHPLDVQTLLQVFRRLIAQGATVIVIEHDLDLIRNADYVIDMGPGGGIRGGKIVASGTPEQIAACPESLTGKYLHA
jgi:tetratricopeptide (TPR) repeat protein